MGSLITGVLAVIALTGFFGSVVVFLMGSKDKGTIETLTRSNAALNERVGLLEREKDDMKNRVSVLEAENAGLMAQRPSADAIAALAEQTQHLDGRLNTHDAETKAMIAASTTAVLEELQNGGDPR